MMSLKVLHVAHGIEQAQTGAGYAVPRMCCALAQQGVEIKLAALDLGGEVLDSVSKTDRLEIYRFPYIRPRKIGYSRALRSFLKDAIKQADIVQTHFLWSYPGTRAARMALNNGKPVIIMPRGALFHEALSKSRLAKSIWFKFVDGPALKEAQCLVATSEKEAESIHKLIQPRRLEIIPEGIDFPNLVDKAVSRQLVFNMIGNGDLEKYLLYLGYLSPHKNVEKLLTTWSKIQELWPGLTLVVVGPGNPRFIRHLERFTKDLKLDTRVKILPAVYGEGKWALLNGAEALVLPSRSENFGFVVGEALYCGTPVVASRGYPWPCLETEGFGHWVDPEDGFLAEAINDVLSWPPDRRLVMAQHARLFIEKNYSWGTVADRYIALYHDLLR